MGGEGENQILMKCCRTWEYFPCTTKWNSVLNSAKNRLVQGRKYVQTVSNTVFYSVAYESMTMLPFCIHHQTYLLS